MVAPEIAEIARISAALVDALREAHAMAQAGRFGADFSELVRHTREMSELLSEAIANAGDQVEDQVRTFAATLSATIERMELLVQGHEAH